MVREIRTEKEFESLMKSDMAVIDFWAEWCMPCVSFAPTFEKLAAKFKKIAFAKCNVDDNAELAERFQINTIPALLVFKKGRLAEKIPSGKSEEELEGKFRKL